MLLQNDPKTGRLEINGEEGSLILLGFAHQVSTEHEEADEVDVGQVAAAAELFTRLSVGFWVTASTGQSCQHNLLPLLSSGTSTSTQRGGSISMWACEILSNLVLENESIWRKEWRKKKNLYTVAAVLFQLKWLTWRVPGPPWRKSGSCSFCWYVCRHQLPLCQMSERRKVPSGTIRLLELGFEKEEWVPRCLHDPQCHLVTSLEAV